jgi:hypothetical protein
VGVGSPLCAGEFYHSYCWASKTILCVFTSQSISIIQGICFPWNYAQSWIYFKEWCWNGAIPGKVGQLTFGLANRTKSMQSWTLLWQGYTHWWTATTKTKLCCYRVLIIWILCFSRGRLGYELRTLCLQSRHSIARATPLVHFALVVLEVGFPKLFAQDRLEHNLPCQPPK